MGSIDSSSKFIHRYAHVCVKPKSSTKRIVRGPRAGVNLKQSLETVVIKYLVGAAAMATVAFPSIACAQSSVTLYGIIENDLAYFSSSSAKLGGPSKHLFQAFSPLGEWGLTGAEDLGGGLKAIFTLENGFSGFNGAALQGGRMFGRQAFVGLR